jgi:hypothetical protein
MYGGEICCVYKMRGDAKVRLEPCAIIPDWPKSSLQRDNMQNEHTRTQGVEVDMARNGNGTMWRQPWIETERDTIAIINTRDLKIKERYREAEQNSKGRSDTITSTADRRRWG